MSLFERWNKMRRVISTLLTVLFIICILLLVGCSQTNSQSSGEEAPTVEEQVEGVWFAYMEPFDLPSSCLILSSTGEVYLSADCTVWGGIVGDDSAYYVYTVYKGTYSIVQSDYIMLELTHFDHYVDVYDNPLECFNADTQPLSNIEIKIYKVSLNYLTEIGEQSLKYTRATSG